MPPLTDAVALPFGERGESAAVLEAQLAELNQRYAAERAAASPAERARMELEIARFHAELDDGESAWRYAEPAARAFVELGDWSAAVEGFDVLFRSDQAASLAALGQGVWLAVSMPVDPELSVTMLQHIVDETPDDSDGAAVAAAAAVYLVELRAQDETQHKNLHFFASQLLGVVARRHGEVTTQAEFELWFSRLELDDPTRFLPRLRNVIDVLVQDDWWFDRDALRAAMPED